MTKENLGTGRRKTSVASVRIKRGTGKFVVNDKKVEEYFPIEAQRVTLNSPFEKLGLNNQYDVFVRVKGGGIEGQVIATRLGISRALVEESQERKKILKEFAFLTRDPRMKERKKYGRAKARKRFQFSKR
ncbi:MAG: 30S ribosomal protein S9 [Chlamydiae bacterium]|jgi:small subunit ribosomal protein S9|nr:30S ribosomal protein S9 [Chlamydiota bacterium]